MPTFNLISVKYGINASFDPWIENGQAEAWFTNMAGSQQYFGWLSEYNTPTQSIQPGTYGGNYSITANVSQPATIAEDEIVATLITAIDQNQVPAPDNTTQYILHIPRGQFVNSGPGLVFCSSMCAYHSHFYYNNMAIKFSIVPYSSDCPVCANSFEVFGSTVSHEIAETITDPLGTSWGDACNYEIGDICAYNITVAKGTDGNEYPVQRLWSNSRGRCYAGSSSGPTSASSSRYIVEGYQGSPVSGTPQSAVCPQGTYASAIAFFTDTYNRSIAGVGLVCSGSSLQEVYFSGATNVVLFSNADESGFNRLVAVGDPTSVTGIALEVNGKTVLIGDTEMTSVTLIGTPSCFGNDVIVGFTEMSANAEDSLYMASFNIVCESVNSTAAPSGMPSMKPTTNQGSAPTEMPFAMPAVYPATAPSGMPSAGMTSYPTSGSLMRRASQESAEGLQKKMNLRSKL